MILTEMKAKAISDYLTADVERAQGLLEMTAEDAAIKMNADGCDVTADELVEFGGAMVQVSGEDELSDTELEGVAGGIAPVLVYAAACGIALGCGYIVGRLEQW